LRHIQAKPSRRDLKSLRRLFFPVLAALTLPLQAAAADHPDHTAYRLLKLGGQIVKWGEPAHGTSAVVTYRFVEQETAFDDARNCRAMGPVDPILAFNGIEKAAFEAAVDEAFRTWEAISGVRFEKAASMDEAGILIGIDLGNHGWAHADVKTEPTGAEFDVITRGLVCLSTLKSWKIGFGANPDAQDIQYTLTHEIGHAIGLNHASPKGQVMSFIYGEDFSELQPGDIEGARALYGMPSLTTSAQAATPNTPAR
jgi:hypothetical protein